MTITHILPVPYHGSSDTVMDGAAAVHMILDQIGPLAAALQGKTETEIHGIADAEIQANNSEPQDWYSDPDGVRAALENLKPPPPAFNGMFVVYSLGTADQASRKLAYTLHRYQVAGATLVYNGGHWIVVKGVQTDVDPLTNPTYSILGFWIHNPWPGPWGQPIPGAPVQDVWVPYADWINTYMTANVYGSPGGKWLNKYVSVCDPDPLPEGELTIFDRPQRADGNELLTPEQVEPFLRLEVGDLDLVANTELRRAWEAGMPGRPVLVQHLHRPGSLSYLVPWQTGGQTALVFDIDARSGLLREAAILTQPTRWPYLRREELMQRLAQGSVEVLHSSPRRARDLWKREVLNLWPGTWCVQKALVWLPCWESRSPAFPFYVLSVADRVYYISTLDGTAYGRLHGFGVHNRFRRGGA